LHVKQSLTEVPEHVLQLESQSLQDLAKSKYYPSEHVKQLLSDASEQVLQLKSHISQV